MKKNQVIDYKVISKKTVKPKKKRIEIEELYKILAVPLPLTSTEVMKIKNCSRNTALLYMKVIQDAAAQKGERVSPKYITKAQLLAFEGWDWELIREEALLSRTSP